MVRRSALPSLAPHPKPWQERLRIQSSTWVWLVCLLFLRIPGAGNTGILRSDLEIKRGHVSSPALHPTALLSQTLVALLSTLLLLSLG